MAALRTLVVVPYIGEFGWELMNWQGRVRYLVRRKHYERVIVCARPDRRRLYVEEPGFRSTLRKHSAAPVVFCPLPSGTGDGCDGMPGWANNDHRVNAAGRPFPPEALRELVKSQVRRACAQHGVSLSSAEFFSPSYRSTIWPTSRSHQWFTNLRVPGEITTDILLVPRHRSHADRRNRTADWWQTLCERLRARGLRVETYEPRVDRAIVQLSRARLAVGASTGGLHLASLCGCPHYVWGSGAQRRWTPMQMTNRQRYETLWNPLGTPCRYEECGWHPAMDHVVDQARRALDEIGMFAGRSAGRHWIKQNGTGPRILSRSLRWRVKRRLARVMETPPCESIWPWPVQRLVRERLV